MADVFSTELGFDELYIDGYGYRKSGVYNTDDVIYVSNPEVNDITATFRSDGSTTAPGFHINVFAIPCDQRNSILFFLYYHILLYFIFSFHTDFTLH